MVCSILWARPLTPIVRIVAFEPTWEVCWWPYPLQYVRPLKIVMFELLDESGLKEMWCYVAYKCAGEIDWGAEDS